MLLFRAAWARCEGFCWHPYVQVICRGHAGNQLTSWLPTSASALNLQALTQTAPAVAAAAAAAAGLGGAAASQQQQPEQQLQRGWQQQLVCTEYTRDRRRVYRRQPGTADVAAADDASAAATTSGRSRKQRRRREADGSSSRSTAGGWEITDDAVGGKQRWGDLVSDYLLPQGYPESVGPEYSTYMSAYCRWWL